MPCQGLKSSQITDADIVKRIFGFAPNRSLSHVQSADDVIAGRVPKAQIHSTAAANRRFSLDLCILEQVQRCTLTEQNADGIGSLSQFNRYF